MMETTGYHHQATLDHQSITATAAAAAAAHKQIIHHHQQQQFYHHDDKLNHTSTQPAGRQGKSSLEMLRLSCEQLQVKTPNSMRPLQEQKTVETITSAYDKMSEIDAFNILKKKILKDTTHCHLWMFLFDILLDSNKSNVATWEDQKGMFRIRDPTKLAEMWGEKRNRTNMTYEKLSRSLRHYYEKKILRKVPKRKYTYKFNSREILKSYEVQPFYRRSNSNSQAQRNAAAAAAAAAAQQANQAAQMTAAYQTSPASGQCSPYTPSPSYQHHNAGFNWNHVPAFPHGWPMMEAPQLAHTQHYQLAAAGKQWQQHQMPPVYQQARAAEQQLMQSAMSSVPTTSTSAPHYHHMTPVAVQTSQPTTAAAAAAAVMYADSSTRSAGSYMTQHSTDLQQQQQTPSSIGSPATSIPEEKLNLDLIIENFNNKAKRSHSLPAITPASPTYASATSNALFNQNNSNSNLLQPKQQIRCRANSVNSYESSSSSSNPTDDDSGASPDSIYSNDAMFNDIMESLVMEAF